MSETSIRRLWGAPSYRRLNTCEEACSWIYCRLKSKVEKHGDDFTVLDLDDNFDVILVSLAQNVRSNDELAASVRRVALRLFIKLPYVERLDASMSVSICQVLARGTVASTSVQNVCAGNHYTEDQGPGVYAGARLENKANYLKNSSGPGHFACRSGSINTKLNRFPSSGTTFIFIRLDSRP